MNYKIFILLLAVLFFSNYLVSCDIIIVQDLLDDSTAHIHMGPQWSSDSQNVYFNSPESNLNRICKMDIKTRDIRVINTGNTLHYLLDVDPNNDNLLVIDLNTSITSILTKEGVLIKDINVDSNMILSPKFSPDGQYLAYISDYFDSEPEVYLYDIRREKITSLDVQNVSGIIYDWNTDNALTYINSETIKEEVDNSTIIYREIDYNVYTYSFPHRKSQKITHFTNCQMGTNSVGVSWPKWAPDSEKLICVITENTAQEKLAILDKNGNMLKVLANNNENISYIFPEWSPDGKKIAFIIRESIKRPDYPKYSLALIELDPSLQSGPRPEKIPEIKIGTFNLYLYLGTAIVIIALAGIGYVLIKRKKECN